MKPNQHQQQLLQQYLGENLKYRETYAEFYDHILTALEHKPADCNFEDAARGTINNDFGGVGGMRKIEDNYQRSIFKDMQRKYFQYSIENLKLPVLGILALSAILVYNIIRLPYFNFMEFLLLLLTVRIIPNVLQAIRRAKSPHIYGAPRRSIRQGFFRWVNIIPGIIVCSWIFLTPDSHINTIHDQPILPISMTIIFILLSFHSLTFYKVYKDDIKSSFKSV